MINIEKTEISIRKGDIAIFVEICEAARQRLARKKLMWSEKEIKKMDSFLYQIFEETREIQ